MSIDWRKYRGGQWLSAEDLDDGPEEFTVIAVREPTINGEQKVALYFEETSKALLLNSTNIDLLLALYGKDESKWMSRKVELFLEPTEFQGKATRGIRIRKPGSGHPDEYRKPGGGDSEDFARDLRA